MLAGVTGAAHRLALANIGGLALLALAGCGGRVRDDDLADAALSDVLFDSAPSDETSKPGDSGPGGRDGPDVGPSVDADDALGGDVGVPGEFPVAGGDCLKRTCPNNALCDSSTKWCCDGTLAASKCVCGDELGCKPPETCCLLPGATRLRCVIASECPRD